MSISPTMLHDNPHKRRRTSAALDGYGDDRRMLSPVELAQQGHGQVSPAGFMLIPADAHIGRRVSRACTACRKSKSKCEGKAPCRRCNLNGTPCNFEKTEKMQQQQALQTGSVERVARLEGQYLVMQSQMIGVQNSLDRILATLQQQQQPPAPSARPPSAFPVDPALQSQNGDPSPSNGGKRPFPPLPGFAPPPHKYATYGIVPSTAPSSDDESEDTLPRSTINAPIEALQGLANAAVEAASTSGASSSAPRVKRRKRVEPIPPNAYPHVVEKGLVSDAEARELYHIFFSGCHLFIPLFDPSYDTYDALKERTPWCFDSILAVASQVKAGNGPPSPTFYKCLEEAQGIARSTLFGPIVRKEGVQAMVVLAAWSQSGWLPSGHAMRMALDLGLHRALEKLVDTSHGKRRSDEEERDLGNPLPVVSARIWLCLYWLDHQLSLGTGRPIVLCDEDSVRNCRVLLSHPMATATDVRLVAQIELIGQKTTIYETLNSSPPGQATLRTPAFVRRANLALDKWWQDCDELHRSTMDEDTLLRKVLVAELHYAKLWLVCVALRGASWDKMPCDQRELAFQAKDAATNCINTLLTSHHYRAALRYAVHDSWVMAAFSGLFLLKIANLFPGEVDLNAITLQVEQLAALLSEVSAERYAMTLRLMLANFKRKIGMTTPANVDAFSAPAAPPELPPPTLEDIGLSWPGAARMMSPSNMPLWLQEASLTDLGLPINGSDGIFLNMPGGVGVTAQWGGEMPGMPGLELERTHSVPEIGY
ncbi:hypothetical protein AURDEDRAFT_131278 [Auricularia subglabra TFB-10046 SS5]|uniref:Zn(2)-C6 fungal-type domain-containing protein n=1 Tax=Auricularia subglabra (strain TFB-10046 / SS5) TaxID=717982 RepID=J0WQP9_AURST|nr:hypothetical protein AURDEDRAFT_131278 [Auricularia subglabra TFB-10046 SS5]